MCSALQRCCTVLAGCGGGCEVLSFPSSRTHLLPPADKLPGGAQARLVYQDSDGDWLLLQPEAPWQLFQRTVRKLVISCRQ